MKANKALTAWGGKLCAALAQYKYVLAIMLAGALLLLLPLGGAQEKTTAVPAQKPFDVAQLEQKLARTLSRIEGAGETAVVLSLRSGARQILAQDSKTTARDGTRDQEIAAVVVSRGAGTQETVALQEVAPQFQGALVVCAGGDDPATRLKLVEAVSALTGLGADKISICKGK